MGNLRCMLQKKNGKPCKAFRTKNSIYCKRHTTGLKCKTMYDKFLQLKEILDYIDEYKLPLSAVIIPYHRNIPSWKIEYNNRWVWTQVTCD